MATAVDLMNEVDASNFCCTPPPVMFVEPTVTTMVFVSFIQTSTTLTITYSLPVSLSGPALIPANWIVTGGGIAVQVTGVSPSGSTVILTITPQTQGSTYTLNMPAGISGISGSNFIALGGVFSFNFTGNGNPPFVVVAVPEDARLLDVIFNEPVVVSEALIPGNYIINNGVTVSGVSQISSTTFRVAT